MSTRSACKHGLVEACAACEGLECETCGCLGAYSAGEEQSGTVTHCTLGCCLVCWNCPDPHDSSTWTVPKDETEKAQ